MTSAEINAIRDVIREELRIVISEELRAILRAMVRENQKRRGRRCGTGSRPPECYGSAVYGPQGCTCP